MMHGTRTVILQLESPMRVDWATARVIPASVYHPLMAVYMSGMLVPRRSLM